VIRGHGDLMGHLADRRMGDDFVDARVDDRDISGGSIGDKDIVRKLARLDMAMGSTRVMRTDRCGQTENETTSDDGSGGL